jgi:hypothetical protein
MATIINLPASVGWRECVFDPVVVRNMDRMEGRRTESMRSGTAYWRATYRSTNLTSRQMGDLEAFMMRAGDGGEVFRAYDASRPRPIEYEAPNHAVLSGTRAGGGAFDGTATVTARTATTLTLSSLPANFQFRRGDYVEVRKSNELISLHRLVGDAQANSSGVVTLTFRYALDLQTFTLPLTANFEKPCCLMQVVPGSFDPSKPLVELQGSFQAEEVFVP